MENIKIGELLKNARVDKKLSIEDVSLKTKISINILKNLEANRLDMLPNKTYVRGFVKTYAKIVGISSEDIITSLDFTYGESTREPETPTEIIENDPGEKQKRHENEDIQDNLKSIASSLINKKFLIGIVVAVIIFIAIKSIGAFFSQLSNEQVKIVKEDKVELEKVVDSTPEETEIDTTASEEEKKTKEDQAQKIKEDLIKEKEIAKEKEAKAESDRLAILKKKQAEEKSKKAQALKEEKAKAKAKAQESEEKKKEEPKKVELNGKYPKIDFYPAPTKMFTIISDAKENSDDEILPSRFRNAIEDGKQNIYIRAYTGDSWISYQSDDDEIKRFVLRKGRSVIIKGDKILLFMGNVNESKIFYNNQLIDTPTKSGVKSLIFPQSLASEYQLPLFPSFKGIPMKASEYKANMSEE